MAKKVLRVGVVGAGNMGRHHIRNYSEMSQADLVAVSDPDSSKKELAEANGARFFDNYKEMIDRGGLDAVSIVVPTHLHLETAKYALSAGIHTLVEKPIAHSPAEADILINLAEEKKLVFTVGHIERYNPVVKRLYQLIQEGRLGQISAVVCKRVGGFPAIEPKTDVIVDLAVHDIDIISSLLGREPHLIGSHTSRTFHSKKFDSAEILLGFDGASGFIQANWVTPVKVRTISVTGSRGYVEANYITQEIVFYENSIPLISGQKEFKDFVGQLGNPQTHRETPRPEEPLRNELNEFLLAVSTGNKNSVVNPSEAKKALEIALEATKDLIKEN